VLGVEERAGASSRSSKKGKGTDRNDEAAPMLKREFLGMLVDKPTRCLG